MYAMSRTRNNFMIHIENFQPYFYIECSDNYSRKQFTETKEELMKIMFYGGTKSQIYSDETKNSYLKSPKDLILVWKESLMFFKGKGETKKYFIKVVCPSVNAFYTVRNVINENRSKLTDLKVQGNLFEEGIPFPLRFLIDHHLSGMSWMTLSAGKYHIIPPPKCPLSKSQQEIIVDFKNLVPRKFSEENFSLIAPLRVLSFDIECYSKRGFPKAEENPVITIGICFMEHDKEDEVRKMVLQLKKCEPIAECHLVTFSHEKHLLEAFNRVLEIYDPDILTGYNIQNFDMDYLLGRMKELGMEAPVWGRRCNIPTVSVDAKIMAKSMGYRKTKKININGRIQMDMMMHMLKEKKFSSYSLNNVSFVLLNEQKEDVPYKMISVLQDGYGSDRKRLASYCLKDSLLPIRLMNKLKCIYNNVEMARVTGVPINYLFTRGQQIKVVSQIHNDTKHKDLLVPGRETYKMLTRQPRNGEDFGEDSKAIGFQGAYVLEPKVGFYLEPIATLDFASLYPSIMIRHNLCYSTIVKNHNLTESEVEKTPEGTTFVRSSVQKGILPQILENLLTARKGVKGQMKGKKKLLNQVLTELENIEETLKKQEEVLYSTKHGKGKSRVVQDKKPNALLEYLQRGKTGGELEMEILKETPKKLEREREFEVLSEEEVGGLRRRKEALILERKLLENTIAVMDGRQLALKISANSVYGFTGAQRGSMPCLEIAGSVTAFGRKMIDHTRNKVMEIYSRKNGFEHDADVIYGDTDSVMIKFGTKSLVEAMSMGKEAAKVLTKEFKEPIKLEFEKVYYPYLLLSKKRYAGNFWTRPEKYDKKDCKGLESVRRDNCLLVRTMVGKVIDILLNDKDVFKAKSYVKNRIFDLQNGNIDLSKLIISKSLSKNLNIKKLDKELGIESGNAGRSARETTFYTNNSPHVSLAERLYKRNPTNPPIVGDRIPYVIVKGPKKSKLYQNSEDPLYALEKDLPIDIDYYIERQVKPPMKRIFDAVEKDHDIFTGKVLFV